MPQPDLITISLLITNACLIILTVLYWHMRRDKQHLHIDTLDVEMVVDQRAQSLFDDFRALVKEGGETTRKDFQEVKTALRDDEKDDQRSKAAARRKKAQA